MKSLLPLLTMLCLGAAWAAADMPPLPDPLRGSVAEVRDAGSYTYLRLQTKAGDVWAAISPAPVRVGADVTIETSAVMTDFESRSLNRRFDRIVFGTLAGAGRTTSGAQRDLGAMHAGVGKPVDAGAIKVARATGADARTVAEIVSGSTALKDKPVTVRAKIVKFTPGVLGRNWMHVRDGTGSASDGTHDVVVTTLDEARVGEVVLVKGVVRTDRDLGSGYTYKVLVDDARLTR